MGLSLLFARLLASLPSRSVGFWGALAAPWSVGVLVIHPALPSLLMRAGGARPLRVLCVLLYFLISVMISFDECHLLVTCFWPWRSTVTCSCFAVRQVSNGVRAAPSKPGGGTAFGQGPLTRGCGVHVSRQAPDAQHPSLDRMPQGQEVGDRLWGGLRVRAHYVSGVRGHRLQA